MITDNKYIDIAHTISLNCVFEDGRKNYIKAMLEFAEVYHEMELKKLRVGDVIWDNEFETVANEIKGLFELELRKFSEWIQSNTSHLNYDSIELVNMYINKKI